MQIKSFQFVLEVDLHHEKHVKEPKNEPLRPAYFFFFFDTRTLHFIHLTGSTIVLLYVAQTKNSITEMCLTEIVTN